MWAGTGTFHSATGRPPRVDDEAVEVVAQAPVEGGRLGARAGDQRVGERAQRAVERVAVQAAHTTSASACADSSSRGARARARTSRSSSASARRLVRLGLV